MLGAGPGPEGPGWVRAAQAGVHQPAFPAVASGLISKRQIVTPGLISKPQIPPGTLARV